MTEPPEPRTNRTMASIKGEKTIARSNAPNRSSRRLTAACRARRQTAMAAKRRIDPDQACVSNSCRSAALNSVAPSVSMATSLVSGWLRLSLQLKRWGRGWNTRTFPTLARLASLAGRVDNSWLLQSYTTTQYRNVAITRHNVPRIRDIHRKQQNNQEFAAQFET